MTESLKQDRTVYVKTVAAADLPDEIRAKAGGATQLYAIHGPNGEPLALCQDRKIAFVLARRQDYAPVSVH